MDAATKEALRKFIVAVIDGTNLIKSSECKILSQDPNPEWFSGYDGFKVKMHTSVSREALSGLKIVYKGGEYSFFNLGLGKKPVGYSRAVRDCQWAFPDWTACVTWDQAKLFLQKLLADSKAKNKYTH